MHDITFYHLLLSILFLLHTTKAIKSASHTLIICGYELSSSIIIIIINSHLVKRMATLRHPSAVRIDQSEPVQDIF